LRFTGWKKIIKLNWKINKNNLSLTITST
jgi:hypothetical protein